MHTNYGEMLIDIDERTGRAKRLPSRPGTHHEVVRREAVAPPPGPRIQPKPDDGDTPKYRSKLEARYASHLEALKFAGEIRTVRYEAIRLEIAPHTTLLPDFFIELPDRTCELHEVKGFVREDSWVKLKTAAALWPWFRFFLITRKKGDWIVKRVPSA